MISCNRTATTKFETRSLYRTVSITFVLNNISGSGTASFEVRVLQFVVPIGSEEQMSFNYDIVYEWVTSILSGNLLAICGRLITPRRL